MKNIIVGNLSLYIKKFLEPFLKALAVKSEVQKTKEHFICLSLLKK